VYQDQINAQQFRGLAASSNTGGEVGRSHSLDIRASPYARSRAQQHSSAASAEREEFPSYVGRHVTVNNGGSMDTGSRSTAKSATASTTASNRNSTYADRANNNINVSTTKSVRYSYPTTGGENDTYTSRKRGDVVAGTTTTSVAAAQGDPLIDSPTLPQPINSSSITRPNPDARHAAELAKRYGREAGYWNTDHDNGNRSGNGQHGSQGGSGQYGARGDDDDDSARNSYVDRVSYAESEHREPTPEWRALSGYVTSMI
jgi:hypothetical protein